MMTALAFACWPCCLHHYSRSYDRTGIDHPVCSASDWIEGLKFENVKVTVTFPHFMWTIKGRLENLDDILC